MATSYTPIYDASLQQRVRSRYQLEIAELETRGFRRWDYCLESLGPYSAIYKVAVLALAYVNKEVLVFPPPLQLAVATPILAHEDDPPTMAMCMGLGIKFYSLFADGTLLISPTFQSHAVPREGSRIIKPIPFSTIEGTWRSHRAQAAKIESHGVIARAIHSFSDYVEMSRIEEDSSQYL